MLQIGFKCKGPIDYESFLRVETVRVDNPFDTKGLIIKFDIIIIVAMSRTHMYMTCGFWSAIFGLICRCRRSLYSEEELQQPCMYK